MCLMELGDRRAERLRARILESGNYGLESQALLLNSWVLDTNFLTTIILATQSVVYGPASPGIC